MNTSFEFDDKRIVMELAGPIVIFRFGNVDDAEKFFIAYTEGMRIGGEVSLRGNLIPK